MSLARELLKVSERETVLDFLDECRVFWKMEDGRLDRWSAAIRACELPQFGANLFYNYWSGIDPADWICFSRPAVI